jgi:hypothetical protein
MTAPRAVPFEPGQIVVLGAGPEHARRWYRTSVYSVDARLVWVDAAPEGQPLVDVQPGENLTCHTWRAMDALYRVEASVAFARLAPDPLVGLTVRGAARIQQREYVRVPLSTVATGLYVGPAAGVEYVQKQQVHLEVSDLSAGGLRGRSDLPLAPGDELALDLTLPSPEDPKRKAPVRSPHLRRAARPETGALVPLHLRGRVVALPDLPEPLNLRARVVRLIETTLRPEHLSPEIGVVFVDVTRDARERIIRFALDVQRDRRRRGMM